MQPKSLSNLTPDQLRANAEANQEFQRADAYKYFEEGRKALHEALAIKAEMSEMMIQHIRNRATLDQTIKRLAITVVIYGLFQIMGLMMIIDWASITQSFTHFVIILGAAIIGTLIFVFLDRKRKAD